MAAIEPEVPDPPEQQVPSLSARVEERFTAPFKRNAFAARTWQLVAVAFVIAVYGAGLLLLLRWDAEKPQQLARQEETPVEVVVEKPKPKPPAKKPEPPKPEAKREIEKPATSAPRAPSEEKVETDKLDKETHAPKAPEPPTDGKPDEAKEAASPSAAPAQPTQKDEAAAEKKPVAPDKDAEPLDKTVPLPPKRPIQKEAQAKPAKLRRERTAMRRLAGTSDLPDYKFARPSKKSPVYGGSEDSRYLAIVYGLIMRKYRATAFAPPDSGSVTLTFDVDSDGSVVDIDVAQTSGYPEIDAAAVLAIRRASPFPPPPAGAPHGLIAKLDVTDAGQQITTSPRGR